jgi:hypothetical protein
MSRAIEKNATTSHGFLALRSPRKVAGRAGVKVAEFAGWLLPKAPRGSAWLRSNRPTPPIAGFTKQ